MVIGYTSGKRSAPKRDDTLIEQRNVQVDDSHTSRSVGQRRPMALFLHLTPFAAFQSRSGQGVPQFQTVPYRPGPSIPSAKVDLTIDVQ